MNIFSWFKSEAKDKLPTGAAQSQTHAERYREYTALDPHTDAEHTDHDTCWTAAPGVWHCRDCHEWFRTWKMIPSYDTRQDKPAWRNKYD
jgi:hypothetical protein